VHIRSDDGSDYFISAVLAKKLSLDVGVKIGRDVLDRLSLETEAVQIRDKTLDFLSRREYSKYQLSLKLRKAGFSRNLIHTVLDDLEAEGIIDDRRFAERWLEMRLRRHPEGYPALLAGLRKRGIDLFMAENLINELQSSDPHIFEDALRRSAEKAAAKKSLSKEKMMRKLIDRGFKYTRVKAVLDSILDDESFRNE
jgi:regulatory protein